MGMDRSEVGSVLVGGIYSVCMDRSDARSEQVGKVRSNVRREQLGAI